MSRHHRTWIVISAVTLVCLSTSAFADESVADSSETVAKWKDDELVPPLPLDPAARAAAIEEARTRAAVRATAQPVGRTATYTSSSRAVAQAQRVSPHATIPGPAPSDPSAARWLSALQTRLRGPDDAPGSTNPNTITLDELGTATSPQGTTALLNVFEVFDGVDDTGLRPPAPDIAAGPNHLLVATTDRFAVMDKCGQTLLTSTFRDFFNLPASRVYYTPRVIYDEWNDRWVMVFIGTETNYSNSSVFMAYSATYDPTGLWYVLNWSVSNGVAGLKDLPCVAATPDALYFAWDRFNLATFAFESAVIGQIDRAAFYSGGGVTMYMYPSLTNPNDASPALSIRPAQMRTYSGEVWFINSKNGGDDFFTLWKITGPPAASVLTGYDVATGAYTVPPDVAQPDATLLDSGDCRITDAVYSSGHVYTTNGASGSGRPSIRISRVDVASIAYTYQILIPSPSFAHAYGALDIDENDQLSVVYSTWGNVRFAGVDCSVVRFPVANLAFSVITDGTANFHSGVAPYRWGPYAGCARDPSDDRTMWLCSVYASDSPPDSWTTTVAAVSLFGESQLTWTPTSTTYSGGFEGGPFSTDTFTFNVQNTGQTTANWYLFDQPGWVTSSDVSGHLGPGDSEPISFSLNAAAYSLTQDIETGFLTLENCTGSESNNPQLITLAVGLDGSCLGARLFLFPTAAGPPTAPGLSTQDIGVFVTAIEDVTVCSVGFTADVQGLPQTAYARIYAANGTTRGALLTEGVLDLVVPGLTTHYIPLEYTLQACQEYEIAFLFTGPVSFDGWTDASISLPYDVGGVVRVRKGSSAGLPNGVLKPIEVISTESACQTVTTFYPGGSLIVDYGPNANLGAYVNPTHTVRLCSLGFKMLAPPGADVRAKVYSADSGTRVSLLAQGHTLSTTPVLDFVDVPIDVLVVGGNEYDFAIEVDGTVFGEFNTSGVTPYTQDGIFGVQSGEFAGTGNPVLPSLRVAWTADQPGTSFNLGKPNGPYPPPVQLNGPMSVGAWVTSLIDQELYSLGVYADIPTGGIVSMVIYPASGTTITGPALSYGSIASYAGGSHWHDVPLSASLDAGADYVFDIFAFTATGARAWLDTSGLPYDVYGILRIRDADSDGNPAFDKLVQMRMCACNAIATPVVERPIPTPMFLDPAAPNPVGNVVTFRYGVDEDGPVSLEIFDVAGRRVAQVKRESSTGAGPASADFDTTRLVSGIYFAKLTTATKSVSRKFVVAH